MPRNRHQERAYDSPSEDEACASPSCSEPNLHPGHHQNGHGSSINHSGSHGGGGGGKTRGSKLKASMTKLRESSRGVREKLGKVHLPHVHLPSLHLSKRLHHKEPAGGPPHEAEGRRRKGGRKKLLKAGRGSSDLNDWGMTHEEELQSVEQFKSEILSREEEAAERDHFSIRREHLEDENKLLRFLKARNFDLAKATEMYLKHLRWREENDVDDILFQTFPEREQLLKFYPQGYHMCDKQGRPIYIQYLGGINVHKILGFTNQETILKIFIQV